MAAKCAIARCARIVNRKLWLCIYVIKGYFCLMTQSGTLFLIPVPLADNAAHKSYTLFLKETVNSIKTYIVENEKTARKFLKQAEIQVPQRELKLYNYGKHKPQGAKADYFKELIKGEDVGLMSEAGCPGVADPGADIVAEAHQKNIKVVPLVGPNSIIQAIMASGFSGQSFTFHGYLPINKNDRIKRLKDLEQKSLRYKQTQLFMETPFRNNQLLNDILKTCYPNTMLCLASNINDSNEFIKTQRIADWRKNHPDLHKKPTIFLIYCA